eukprot:5329594-Amphidinium_carterae.1
MAGSAWKPTEKAVAWMRPSFFYLATNVDVEWPPVAETRLSTAYAHEVRMVLEANLKEFEAIPNGEPQWIFEAQDCFQGREKKARTEGHLADGSCMWLCGGNLE